MLPFKPLEKIQDLVNAVLRQDERALAAVGELAGKTLAVQFKDTALTLCVRFAKEGVVFASGTEVTPQVTIKARPLALLGLLLDRDGKTTGITPDLEISGDTRLAQRFQEMLKDLEIDWEEHLAHYLGDIAAHQLGRLGRATRAYLRDTRQTLGLNLSEYLRYEKEILPDRGAVAEFISAVDVLRDDTERLQQRLYRLQKILT